MKLLLILLLAFSIPNLVNDNDFLTEQKKFPRVRIALDEKELLISSKLNQQGIRMDKLNLIFVVYKAEKLLDVFAKQINEPTYKKVLSYSICNPYMLLGPKRKQGDMHVPEGFYNISRYNPVSNFFLSLGINYPNLSDRRKSNSTNPGGDIYIHGSCVSAGCIAVTDDLIKEVYLLAIHARNNGQQHIPVYIFPFKMTDQNTLHYKKQFAENREVIDFWDNLKIGYEKFHLLNRELDFTVDNQGIYIFI